MGPQEKNHYTHARGKLLGVHIGVYQPWYSVQFGNTCYLIHSNKEQIQFTYLIKDSEVFLNDYLFCQARLRMKELPEFEERVPPFDLH